MITGMHATLFSEDADATRAFFGEVLGLPSVDAGEGWLIFALPPAEIAAHPAEEGGKYELYLLCDDIQATVEELEGKGAEVTGQVSDEGWGLVTSIRVPGGAELGLYEPRHPTPRAGVSPGPP